jgi:amino acid transporter
MDSSRRGWITLPFRIVAGVLLMMEESGSCGPRTAAGRDLSACAANKVDNGVMVPATTNPPVVMERISSLRVISFDIASVSFSNFPSYRIRWVNSKMQRQKIMKMGYFGYIVPITIRAIQEKFWSPWKSTFITGPFISKKWGLRVPAESTNIGKLLAFVFVCFSVLIIRCTHPTANRQFPIFSAPLLSILVILSCRLLMFSLPPENWWHLIICLALEFIIYFSYSRRHGSLAKMKKRQAVDYSLQ